MDVNAALRFFTNAGLLEFTASRTIDMGGDAAI